MTVETYRQLVSEILGVSSFEVSDPLCIWIDTVASWNARIDMTAARNDEELVDLMVADAAELSLRLAAGGPRVVDVGSGAGAPGLPLALLRPDVTMTLVEPMQKRAAMLRLTIGKLGLAARVNVLQARDDEIDDTYDVAISRATLPPQQWLERAADLIAPGGEIWVLLAKQDAPALDGLSIVEDVSYRWPLTAAERRLVAYS